MICLNYKGNSTKTGIYCIRNTITNQYYIGSTKRSFHSRKTKHLKNLKNNSHQNVYLQEDWNKYGELNFIFEILLSCSPSECDKWEAHYIKYFDSNIREFGYNIASVKHYRYKYSISEQGIENKSKSKKQKLKISNGLLEKERGLYKPILLHNMKGELIKKYSSGIELSKEKGWRRSSISNILSKRKLHLNKHIIIFENDKLTKSDVKHVQKFLPKKVYLYDLNNNFIKEFSSGKEASEFLGCRDAEVRMCCTKKRKRIKNYITSYESKTIQ